MKRSTFSFPPLILIVAQCLLAFSLTEAFLQQAEAPRQQQQQTQPQEPQAEPYSFSYDSGFASHQESGDGSGRVTGFYTVLGDDGRERRVDYIADENGYRASVKTNEIGTRSGFSADVQFTVQQPSAGQLEAANISQDGYRQLEEAQETELERAKTVQTRLKQQQPPQQQQAQQRRVLAAQRGVQVRQANSVALGLNSQQAGEGVSSSESSADSSSINRISPQAMANDAQPDNQPLPVEPQTNFMLFRVNSANSAPAVRLNPQLRSPQINSNPLQQQLETQFFQQASQLGNGDYTRRTTDAMEVGSGGFRQVEATQQANQQQQLTGAGLLELEQPFSQQQSTSEGDQTEYNVGTQVEVQEEPQQQPLPAPQPSAKPLPKLPSLTVAQQQPQQPTGTVLTSTARPTPPGLVAINLNEGAPQEYTDGNNKLQPSLPIESQQNGGNQQEVDLSRNDIFVVQMPQQQEVVGQQFSTSTSTELPQRPNSVNQIIDSQTKQQAKKQQQQSVNVIQGTQQQQQQQPQQQQQQQQQTQQQQRNRQQVDRIIGMIMRVVPTTTTTTTTVEPSSAQPAEIITTERPLAIQQVSTSPSITTTDLPSFPSSTIRTAAATVEVTSAPAIATSIATRRPISSGKTNLAGKPKLTAFRPPNTRLNTTQVQYITRRPAPTRPEPITQNWLTGEQIISSTSKPLPPVQTPGVSYDRPQQPAVITSEMLAKQLKQAVSATKGGSRRLSGSRQFWQPIAPAQQPAQPEAVPVALQVFRQRTPSATNAQENVQGYGSRLAGAN